tara:strand:- start:167 stop:982 length:816 start_codon:yes stop_codon:yes gene_type:complete
MSKIAIIAGGGSLPIVIGENLIKSGNSVVFFCLESYIKKNDYSKFKCIFIKLELLSKIIKLLKFHNINKIIMAGHVKRPSLKDIQFDYKTIKFIKEYTLQPKGDDKLLLSIVKFFEKEGFNFIDWKKECNELFVNEDNLSKKIPNIISLENLKKGLEVFKTLGKTDLSQSIIIQNNIVLGVEAAEGTDELIKRCYKYKKKGDKGVLIKLSKYNQDNRFDVPVIGLRTLKLLKKFDYEGVFIEKKKLIILDKDKAINFCDNNSIFISSVKKT